MTRVSSPLQSVVLLQVLFLSVLFKLRKHFSLYCTPVVAHTRRVACCYSSPHKPRTSILINNVPSLFLHAGTRRVQPRPGLSLCCCAMVDTGVPVAKAEGGKERRVTLKNAAGLTLVGTFYDAGTLARRCCKPIWFLF